MLFIISQYSGIDVAAFGREFDFGFADSADIYCSGQVGGVDRI